MAPTCVRADIVVDYTEEFQIDLQPDSGWEPVSVADYLFRRLLQLRVRTIHGVTGDSNHQALEYVESSGLKWVEHCSALGAGYAADGYARIKGISALMTTFGSGELCALNAIAAAYAEYIPIVHIVGMPSTKSQGNSSLLHSPLGHGNHGTFADMYRPLSCVCAILDNPAEIAIQVDHALRECWMQSRPVYLGLPADVIHQHIDGERLKVPIDLTLPANDPNQERYVAEVVLRYLNAASSPVILVDAGAIRHRAREEVHELVVKSGVATFVSPMAKGSVDETLSNYCGVYIGSASEEAVRARVESADLVLSIGCVKSDFVSPSGLVYLTSGLPTIHLHSNRVCVRYSEYRGISMKGLLRKIADELRPLTFVAGLNPVANLLFPPRDASLRTYHDSITHLWFWQTLARWLRPHDIVVADAGVPAFGVWGVRSVCQVTSIVPTLWSSDGYGVPACQGATLAMSEQRFPNPESRSPQTVLLTTPRALQAAAPEISVLIAQRLKPVVLILCTANKAEQQPPASTSDDQRDLTPDPLRPHHNGRREVANSKPRPETPCATKQVPRSTRAYLRPSDEVGRQWRYHEFFSALNADNGSCRFSGPVRTRRQLTSLFGDARFSGGSEMQVAEVEFGVTGDAPAGLGRARRAYLSENRWTQRPGDA